MHDVCIALKLFSTLTTIVDIVSQPCVQRNSGAQRAFLLKFFFLAKLILSFLGLKNVHNVKLWEYGIVYNPNKSLVREHCSVSVSSNTMFEQGNSADGSMLE